MQDLTGGRKDQEVLSRLIKYADAQARGYLSTAKKIEQMIPQLEALRLGVSEADKDFQLQKTGREEKRRAIEKSTPQALTHDGSLSSTNLSTFGSNRSVSGNPETDNGRLNGHSSSGNPSERPRTATLQPSNNLSSQPLTFSTSQGNRNMSGAFGSPNQNRYKGYRDLEDKDMSNISNNDSSEPQRKEGILWALSRPGGHVQPTALNKQAWHK